MVCSEEGWCLDHGQIVAGEQTVLPQDPFDFTDDEYNSATAAGKESLDRGIAFVNKLRNHKGWWSYYIDSGEFEKVWKFLLVLAYTIESYSFRGNAEWETFKGFMTESIINKAGEFFQKYGIAGLYTYIGGRDVLRVRNKPDDDPSWVEDTDEYRNAWEFAPDDPNPWLATAQTVFKEAQSEIDAAWSKIMSYHGTYGSGAYDYGVSPPMDQTGQTIVWQSKPIVGDNPCTDEVRDDEQYVLYFHTK